jgi:hypothetical protein
MRKKTGTLTKWLLSGDDVQQSTLLHPVLTAKATVHRQPWAPVQARVAAVQATFPLPGDDGGEKAEIHVDGSVSCLAVKRSDDDDGADGETNDCDGSDWTCDGLCSGAFLCFDDVHGWSDASKGFVACFLPLNGVPLQTGAD